MSLIERGTEIRNVDGELVATIARDIAYGEIVSPDQFVLADGSRPFRGQPMPFALLRFIRDLGL